MKDRDKIEEMAQKLVIANLTATDEKVRISDVYESTRINVVKVSVSVAIDFYRELDTQLCVKPEPDKTK